MERGYNGKMIRKQILRAREHSRKDLLEREKAKTSEPRLTFNITYYPVFQNIRNILQELRLLLAPDKEHKRVFPDVPVVGFRNGKSLKDYLVRAALPKPNETGRCEPCGKKTCLVCNSIRTTTTFTTEVCGEVFKIQSGPLNCNSEKVLYLLKCKVCGEAPYVGKAKTKFRYRFNNYKSKHRAFRKGNRKIPQKRFHDHYCLDDHLGIDDWDFTLFEQCETHKQLKERETFWQHRLKTFYPLERGVLALAYPIYENQTTSYDGVLAQFYFCQLFNYQLFQVYVLVFVCVYNWQFEIQDTRTGTFTLIHCLFLYF